MMLRLLQARRLSPLLSPARRFSTQDIAAARLNEVKAGAAAVTSWVNLYTGALSEYPLRANAVLSGVLCAAGDVLAQTVEQRVEVSATRSYDLLRTARMTTYGTLICGPLLYGWYSTLHVVGEAVSVTRVPLLGERLSGLLPWLGTFQKEVSGGLSPARLLLAKVAADGLFFQAPFLNLCFATMGVLEGRPLTDIYEKTKAAFHRAWGLSLLVWTPIQLLNLSLVPVALQPAVVSTVNVGWKATLSLLNAMHATGLEGRSYLELEAENRDLKAELDGLRSHVVDLDERLRVATSRTWTLRLW